MKLPNHLPLNELLVRLSNPSSDEIEQYKEMNQQDRWLLALNLEEMLREANNTSSEIVEQGQQEQIDSPNAPMPPSLPHANGLGTTFELHSPIGWAAEQTRTINTAVLGLAEGLLEVSVFQGEELGEGYIEVKWNLGAYEGETFMSGWRTQVRTRKANEIIYDSFVGLDNFGMVRITKAELGGVDPMKADLLVIFFPQLEKSK